MNLISSFLLMALIAHVDADCFYVSCERIRDPSLMGKPVGVLGNQGACVIARSYEMKAAGVTVAMPIWMAKKRCPNGIYVKRDFAWYEAVCLRTQEVLRRYSDTLEFYSVDETFLELHGVAMKDAERVAQEIQNLILKEVEVPVSIGVAETRSLAKIASDKNKPFGVMVVSPENHEEFLRTTPVSEICGVGPRLSVRLQEVGIQSCLDYVNSPREQIKALLHKPGEEIWYELQGKPLLTVRTVRPQRQRVSRGGHIPGQSADPEVIYGFFVRHLERLTEALLHYKVEILTLNVILADAQGRYTSSVEALPDYTSDFALLLEATKRGLRKIFRRHVLYDLLHLDGAPVRSREGKQLNLLDQPDPKREKVWAVKQAINDHYGTFKLRSAATAAISSMFKDKGSDYEICDIDGKFCF